MMAQHRILYYYHAEKVNVLFGGLESVFISVGLGNPRGPSLQQTGLILFFGDEEIQKAKAAICS